MTLRIFLSHSHLDSNWCDELVIELSKYDIDIWYDRQGLYAGAQWVRTIEDELSRRDIFLLILTPEAWNSEWVREELALAFASKKRIIGVMHKQTAISGFIAQRQILIAINHSAKDTAELIASNLRITTYQTPAPTSNIIDISGKWQTKESQWNLYITQIGDEITGISHGDRKITGSIKDQAIKITIPSHTGDPWQVLTLKIIAGKLIGTRHNLRVDSQIPIEYHR